MIRTRGVTCNGIVLLIIQALTLLLFQAFCDQHHYSMAMLIKACWDALLSSNPITVRIPMICFPTIMPRSLLLGPQPLHNQTLNPES